MSRMFYLFSLWVVVIGLLGLAFWAVPAFQNYEYKKGAGYAKDAFGLINQERIQNGIQPLVWDGNMAQQATDWSLHMATTNNLTHSGMGYAEDILMGSPDSLNGYVIYNLWYKSHPHHAIYMSRKYIFGAIGVGAKLYNIKVSDTWVITYWISGEYVTFIAQ